MKEINLLHLLLVVFGISWMGVVPGLMIAHGFSVPLILERLDLLMMFGPLIAAVFFIFKVQGREGLKVFFRRLLYFKAPWNVILFAIGVPVLASILSSFIGLKISNTAWPDSFTFPSILANAIMIFVVYLFINTEELVWRGIVFDQLFSKWGFLNSCLFIVPIWWLFHIPLFLYPEGHPAGYGLVEFSLIVIGQTFILGWIYMRSQRSLFYVHIHHQLINGFGQAFPIFPFFLAGNKMPVWVLSIVLTITAGIIVLTKKKLEPSGSFQDK